jgi:hypothetical protein
MPVILLTNLCDYKKPVLKTHLCVEYFIMIILQRCPGNHPEKMEKRRKSMDDFPAGHVLMGG